ncbi:MAG: aldehyde dehydrogenase family protein [Rhodospirillaceae bacterium]
MRNYRLHIDGAWQDGERGLKDVIDPSTEEAVAKVPVAGPRDLDKALAAAVRARAAWADTDVRARAAILKRAAEILAARVGETSRRMVREQGKTLPEASGELERAPETFLWNAAQAEALCKAVQVDGRRTLRPHPVGIVAAFTPWNYPAVIVARKLAPALAAGCPVILKAAEEAPAAPVAIVEALEEAGVPPGVVALVFGDPPMISAHLLESPDVRMLSFTGSTRVGKQLAALAAKNLQTSVLELGGHAPVLIFEDADIASAVAAICDYKFEYAGQSCNAPSRILVHRSRYQDVLSRLAKAVAGIQVGPADNPGVQMGPMIGPRGPERMRRLIDDALAKGARLVWQGQVPEGKGYFWPPTLLADVPATAAILSEEPFGPVLTVAPFDTDNEAVESANATTYGLAAYMFTASAERQRHIAERLAFGNVSVNMLKGVAPDVPNTGIGDSGYGHEGGREGFRAFQNLKLINRTGR